MEDVWITPSNESQLPRWLEDMDVRNGIRALLKLDRCREECQRLELESQNMCRWYGHKLMSIEVALRLPECEYTIRDFIGAEDPQILQFPSYSTKGVINCLV